MIADSRMFLGHRGGQRRQPAVDETTKRETGRDRCHTARVNLCRGLPADGAQSGGGSLAGPAGR